MDSNISSSNMSNNNRKVCNSRHPAEADDFELQSIPKAFLCPLTLQIFEDPVIDPASGHSFSRGAIMEWLFRQGFGGKQTNPLTRGPLRPCDLIPNDRLRRQISAWKADNGIYEEPEKDRKSIPIPWYRQYTSPPTNVDRNATGGEAFVQRLIEAQRRDAEFRRQFILGGMRHGNDLGPTSNTSSSAQQIGYCSGGAAGRMNPGSSTLTEK